MKNYLQIEKVFDLQLQELSTDQRDICRLKKYVSSKKYIFPADGKIFYRSIKYSIFKSKNISILNNYLLYQGTICRSKVRLQIEDLSANQRLIFCSFLIEEKRSIWYADWITICKLKIYYLWIKIQSTDNSPVCRKFLNL